MFKYKKKKKHCNCVTSYVCKMWIINTSTRHQGKKVLVLHPDLIILFFETIFEYFHSSIHPSILSIIHPFTHASIHPSIHPSIYTSSIHLFETICEYFSSDKNSWGNLLGLFLHFMYLDWSDCYSNGCTLHLHLASTQQKPANSVLYANIVKCSSR